MIGTVVRRLLWGIPVLWAAATLVWIFMFLIPGDPARALAGQRADPEVLALVRAEWGLDEPAIVRYGRYLGKVARLDLGTSYVMHRTPVSSIVVTGLIRTIFLAASASLLGSVIGLLVGCVSAARRGTVVDALGIAWSTSSIALPTFWLGLMLILVFASRLGWLPVSGYGDGGSLLGVRLPGPANLVLPSLTLAVFASGYLARVARSSLIEESSREYALAARGRGVSRAGALWRHALANSLLPVVTLAGMTFGHMLGGAIATETVFDWQGLGSVIYRALNNRDLPVVEGAAIVLTAAFVLVNLVVDISYAVLDPRIRD